jgi:hypothetical protein
MRHWGNSHLHPSRNPLHPNLNQQIADQKIKLYEEEALNLLKLATGQSQFVVRELLALASRLENLATCLLILKKDLIVPSGETKETGIVG